MIIKKFIAETEEKAVLMAKEEMGNNAVVLNIKTTKQRGIKRLFKKDTVEITAALEEKTTNSIPVNKINIAIGEDGNGGVEESKSNAIEEKLDNLQSILEARISDEMAKTVKEEKKEKTDSSANVTFIRLIYNQLLDNEVEEKNINQIISEIGPSLKKENNLDSILASVYQKIILKLGSPNLIDAEKGKCKAVFFVGPTGVGKTTTIAKVASDFKLDKDLRVAMITSDTYRIAAVEQLRTYANILDIPLDVVYTIDELNAAIEKYKDYDLILIDTAGRSHKNKEQCMEMLHFVNDCTLPENTDKQIYLVLSMATKYKDLLNIVDVYKGLDDYSLIFTKLDETSALGNILNIKLHTNANLSYITSGQTVPDDISVIDAQKLAKSLLGGGN